MELAARVVKLHNIKVDAGEVPSTVIAYLDSAHRCVNPKCKGIFLILSVSVTFQLHISFRCIF